MYVFLSGRMVTWLGPAAVFVVLGARSSGLTGCALRTSGSAAIGAARTVAVADDVGGGAIGEAAATATLGAGAAVAAGSVTGATIGGVLAATGRSALGDATATGAGV